MKKFKEMDRRKRTILISGIIVVLFFSAVLIYRTYSIYQEQQDYNLIQGSVPNQDYDVKFAYTIESETGNKVFVDTIPEGRDYSISIRCNNGATGMWNYDSWGPDVRNVTKTRTKCNVNFGTPKSLIDTIKSVPVVSSGVGLYQVSHNDASINYTTDATAINNLKMTEYRYAGKNPNNYVKYNGELWRIIGLVNTPEGQRVKIIRDESIGYYSWDSSVSTVNSGYGINEWSQSAIMKVLNPGYDGENGGSLYYNRAIGSCYDDLEDQGTTCNFNSSGLGDVAKAMIDTVTWNTGSNNGTTSTYTNINTASFYNLERSSNKSKVCSSSGTCNDSVTRTITWKGLVGLMYPSDYGYATSGGQTNRSTCLSNTLYSWTDTDCYTNDWLYHPYLNQWTMMPAAHVSTGYDSFAIYANGFVHGRYSYSAFAIRSVVYLKTNVKAMIGDGTIENPYYLSL